MSGHPFDFSGKIALVTGGTRGLGLQMAQALANHGADVIITSRKIEACEAIARQIEQQHKRRALALSAHVGKWNEIDALIDSAYAAFGRIDILINNAGMSPSEQSHTVSEALFDSVINLNFKGPFRLASQVAWRMSQGLGGNIINISASGAAKPLPGIVPYCSAKAALNAMTIGLAREYAPTVRVNAISPGPFLTDIAKAWPQEARESAHNALGRPGSPEEIVTAALFLASPSSSYVTGAIIPVDGGD